MTLPNRHDYLVELTVVSARADQLVMSWQSWVDLPPAFTYESGLRHRSLVCLMASLWVAVRISAPGNRTLYADCPRSL